MRLPTRAGTVEVVRAPVLSIMKKSTPTFAISQTRAPSRARACAPRSAAASESTPPSPAGARTRRAPGSPRRSPGTWTCPPPYRSPYHSSPASLSAARRSKSPETTFRRGRARAGAAPPRGIHPPPRGTRTTPRASSRTTSGAGRLRSFGAQSRLFVSEGSRRRRGSPSSRAARRSRKPGTPPRDARPRSPACASRVAPPEAASRAPRRPSRMPAHPRLRRPNEAP
mmetsp:Transcript_11968/g.54106  ORF Transcript_11968/g.54106 Transcript_11968/m.54106 type:complete len:226 (+) Transcript_11968:1687-2364(+)